MNTFVGVTDKDWFDLLSRTPGLDEVNFWQPSADNAFRALHVGELFLFKLHSPLDYIVGGGFFSHWTKLPVSYAWEAFEVKNGASSLLEMRARIERYKRTKPSPHEDYNIGCILLSQPFFFPREAWLEVPDWQPNIVRGKTYDMTQEPGTQLWHEIQQRLQGKLAQLHEAERRYGEPVLVTPRLGQGSFRVIVADAYKRRCAVTGGKALPVLVAAHIHPFSEGGEHRVDNGILLRSDIHTLFDKGYVTITPDYRLKVSRRLRSDFDNGEEYFTWQDQTITLPHRPDDRPRREFLLWHNENRFAG